MPMKQSRSGNWLLAKLIAHADRQDERRAARLRQQEIDPEILAAAKELARLAIGQSELFPLEKRRRAAFQLRFPGF